MFINVFDLTNSSDFFDGEVPEETKTGRGVFFEPKSIALGNTVQW